MSAGLLTRSNLIINEIDRKVYVQKVIAVTLQVLLEDVHHLEVNIYFILSQYIFVFLTDFKKAGFHNSTIHIFIYTYLLYVDYFKVCE